MTTKSKSKKKARARSGAESRWRRLLPDAERLEAMRRWGAILGGVAALVAIVWASARIRGLVEQDDRFYLNNCVLRCRDLPAWVTPEIESEIRNLRIESDDRLHLLDRGVLTRVRAILEESPWVLSATDLQLVYPTPERMGVIEANVTFRTPIALVRVGNDLYLTDAEELRLGKAYDAADPSVLEWFRLPVIVGAPSGVEVPAEGERWSSRSLLEGLEVARVLFHDGIHLDFPGAAIDQVDVSWVRGGGRGEIVLHSAGRKLIWGRSAYAQGARVLPVERKLANLRTVLSDERYDGRDVILHGERLVSSAARQ